MRYLASGGLKSWEKFQIKLQIFELCSLLEFPQLIKAKSDYYSSLTSCKCRHLFDFAITWNSTGVDQHSLQLIVFFSIGPLLP